MADYNVQSSDGTFTVNVQTGTINNTFDIPFIGQDAINYGDDLVAAQLRLLENFSNTSEPAFGTTRLKGQLWYDSTPTTGRLNIFDGSTFVEIPLDLDVVHISGTETIDDVKTFSSAPIFSASGAPLTVNSDTVVPNLNADKLDGQHATAFATFSQGLLADAAQPALPPNTNDGYVLSANLDNPNIYTWVSLSVAAGQIAMDVNTSNDPSTHVLLVGDATDAGLQDPLYDDGLTYNALTSVLSTGTFVGALTGLATNATDAVLAATATTALKITVADTVSSSTFLVLTDNAAGDEAPLTDAGLTYNATSGQLNATAFAGDGSLITDLDMSEGSHTGTLATARGGTGVTASTGSGGSFALSVSPVFTVDITTPKIASTGTVEIEWNGVTMVQTQDREVLGNTSGATIRSHANEILDVGFNVLPQFSWDTTDILEARHCGHLTGHSDGNPHTLTLEDSDTEDFPIGGVTTIINGSAADYTVTEGSGTTLFYIEPAVGGTDTTGGAVIGAGGVATLYRFSAAIYYIWGSEITP